MSDYNKPSWFKVSMQKSSTFLYTSDEKETLKLKPIAFTLVFRKRSAYA